MGDGKFLKSLYIVDRGMLNLYFMKTPLYCLPPPTSLSLQTPTPNVLSIVLFLWQNGWSHHTWCAILLNDNMDLHMFSLGTLLPQGSWYVLYAKGIKFTEIWNMFFYWYSDLISHTQTHTAHSEASRLTCPYNIYLHHLLYAHSSYLYYIKWLLSTMSFLFKNYSIVKVIYLLIRCYKTRFFQWNKDNTDRNGVIQQNTHIHTQPHLFYQPLHFYGKNLNPPPLPPLFFFKKFENSMLPFLPRFCFFKLRK